MRKRAVFPTSTQIIESVFVQIILDIKGVPKINKTDSNSLDERRFASFSVDKMSKLNET